MPVTSITVALVLIDCVVLEENTISFEDESYLILKGAEKSIWECEYGQFIVEKGDSAQNVGNNTYYSNPLRVYPNQIITISIKV